MKEPPREPFLSVLVTVKNGAKTLPDLLGDFDALDWPARRLEVILVDAFSTDGTWELIQAWTKRAAFQALAVQKKGGISVGRNEGFRLARGEHVAVTDADMRVPPDWLRQLWRGMDSPGIGVVGGPNETAHPDLSSRCQAALPVHGPSRGAVFPFTHNPYRDDYTTDSDVFASVTRNSLFRKEAVAAAGGFDETLVVTEDPELNRRILDAGYRIRYRRDAGVRHVHRSGLWSFFQQQRAYAYWQAFANRKHAAMRKTKHVLPAAALLVLAVAWVGAPFSLAAATVALVLLIAGLLFVLAYAVQAAIARQDAVLLLGLPVYFVTWQLAWAFGFPAGAWRARRAR